MKTSHVELKWSQAISSAEAAYVFSHLAVLFNLHLFSIEEVHLTASFLDTAFLQALFPPYENRRKV